MQECSEKAELSFCKEMLLFGVPLIKRVPLKPGLDNDPNDPNDDRCDQWFPNDLKERKTVDFTIASISEHTVFIQSQRLQR